MDLHHKMSPVLPLLEIRDLECAYGSVKVLSGISLTLEPGKVLGVAGENGAGKSTLVKAICKLLTPSSGTIIRRGKVAAIHQEFNLAPELTVAENLFLGKEMSSSGLLRRKEMYRKAEELFQLLDVKIDPDAHVNDLTVAEKQMVEIAKAVGANSSILIMDEPTTVLNHLETRRLFKLIRNLTAAGTGVIYISHKLDEVLELCDDVAVFRDGVNAGVFPSSQLTAVELAEKMVGRDLQMMFPEKLPENHLPAKLEVEKLCAAGVKEISFALRPGEILGVAGLNGAGRSELAEAIFGLRKVTSGVIRINGKAERITSPAAAMRSGIAFLTEDRQGSGLLLDFPISGNMTLGTAKNYSCCTLINWRKIAAKAAEYIRNFSLKCTSGAQEVRDLSGGNQQKVAIAKCLDSQPEIFIFDEPTRGVDVGARREIYDFVNALARQGAGCLLISSDLEELLGLCSRIMVIRNGSCAGFASGEDLNEQYIIRLATGVVS